MVAINGVDWFRSLGTGPTVNPRALVRTGLVSSHWAPALRSQRW